MFKNKKTRWSSKETEINAPCLISIMKILNFASEKVKLLTFSLLISYMVKASKFHLIWKSKFSIWYTFLWMLRNIPWLQCLTCTGLPADDSWSSRMKQYLFLGTSLCLLFYTRSSNRPIGWLLLISCCISCLLVGLSSQEKARCLLKGLRACVWVPHELLAPLL